MKRFALFLLLSGGLVISSQGYAADMGIASDISVSRPQMGAGARNIYLGGALGNASYDKFGESDVGFDIFGGIGLNEILSVEFGWASLGKPEKGSLSRKVTALHVAIVGNVALQNDLSAFGKLGMAAWDADVDSVSDSGNDVFYGLGLDYQIGASSSVRFGVDFYTLGRDGGDEDITMYAVGIKQKF